MGTGRIGQVTGGDLLTEAIAELYSCEPGEFVERRGVLAARARAAGEAAVAKRIAGLRKPTRSASVLNQLARSAPAATAQLAALGEQLRAAQQALDGAAIRELSVRRRQLIDALARQAFTVAGEPAPSPALRDEVTATLGAALADPRVAGQLRAGALERAAHRDGLGPEQAAPALALLPSSPGRARTRAAKSPAAVPARAAAKSAAAAPARAAAKVTALADARDKAERERRRQIIAAAQQAVAEADQAADAADQAEREQENAVRLTEAQLTRARQRLAGARAEARQARAGQRRARQALDRLQNRLQSP